MGKKYIIELEDKPFHKENGDFLYRVKGFNSLVFDMTGIDKLTPYIKPDLEQVRKEAYEEGYKTAKVQCDIQAEKDMREVGERHYQRGLSDAWEAASEIAVIPYDEVEKIFGATGWHIFMKCTASEVIEKIKAREGKKQEEIKVGDEVDWMGDKYVVTYVRNEAKKADMISCKFGSACENVAFSALGKTGRHFPEIAEVLEKMRGGQDG